FVDPKSMSLKLLAAAPRHSRVASAAAEAGERRRRAATPGLPFAAPRTQHREGSAILGGSAPKGETRSRRRRAGFKGGANRLGPDNESVSVRTLSECRLRLFRFRPRRRIALNTQRRQGIESVACRREI